MELLKIGQKVKYHSVIRSDGTVDGTIETVIESEPWALGHGELVVKVKGISGAVAIRHIDIIHENGLTTREMAMLDKAFGNIK